MGDILVTKAISSKAFKIYHPINPSINPKYSIPVPQNPNPKQNHPTKPNQNSFIQSKTPFILSQIMLSNIIN